MSGSPEFKPDKADIERVAMEKGGNITAIAAHYGVSRQTIYQYLHRQGEGIELANRAYAYNSEVQLDMAEQVLSYNMSRVKEDPKTAQRAAEKVIEMKGQRRGWQRQLPPESNEIRVTIVDPRSTDPT